MGVARKNHAERLVSWDGRALYLVWYRAGRSFFPQGLADPDVGAPGRAPERPTPFCGKPSRISG